MSTCPMPRWSNQLLLRVIMCRLGGCAGGLRAMRHHPPVRRCRPAARLPVQLIHAARRSPSSCSPSPPPLHPRLQGKRVVIIGAGKSAHDVGLVTSRLAASTTLVARRGHWMAPQKVLGGWARGHGCG